MSAKMRLTDVYTRRTRLVLVTPAMNVVTCGTCGRSWDDAKCTDWTPTPAGRCPFEYQHRTPKTAAIARAKGGLA